MPHLLSVNIGAPLVSEHTWAGRTGIDKRPQEGPVQLRAPGAKHVDGIGSGLVGDFVGDRKNHGGDEQAVYAFTREDLDDWEQRLGRHLPNGTFGENFTTTGLQVNDALIGERWEVGDDGVELVVTCPRIPCRTFRGWMGEKGWLPTFTRVARPGAYLAIVRPGTVRAGDDVRVTRRPDHDVTVTTMFRALTTDRDLLPGLLAAEEFLPQETLDQIARRENYAADVAR